MESCSEDELNAECLSVSEDRPWNGSVGLHTP